MPLRHVTQGFVHPLFAVRAGRFHHATLADGAEEFVSGPVECSRLALKAPRCPLTRQFLPPFVGSMIVRAARVRVRERER
jgi:hypothetical protein